MVEKREGRGTFSGGVSVPVIAASARAGLGPVEGSGFLRKESIDFCRCISDFRW